MLGVYLYCSLPHWNRSSPIAWIDCPVRYSLRYSSPPPRTVCLTSVILCGCWGFKLIFTQQAALPLSISPCLSVGLYQVLPVFRVQTRSEQSVLQVSSLCLPLQILGLDGSKMVRTNFLYCLWWCLLLFL